MAKLTEILDRDYQIANNISADKNAHATPSCIKSFKEKYMSFLSNFPEGSRLRKDAILEIKSAMQAKHGNNESVFTPSGQIDNTKFNEIKTASCKELQNKYKNINFSNLSNVSQQYQQLYASESQESKQVIEHNTVDFNNPEETKKYFDNLYKGLLECKTREEKRDYIQNTFGIENPTDEIISNFETRARVRNVKENLDKEAIRKENPDLNNEEFEQLLEDEAAKQEALSRGENPEKAIENNNLMIKFEKKEADLLRLEQELPNCKDEDKRKKKKAELAKIEEEKNELAEILSLTNEEREKTTANTQKEREASLEEEGTVDTLETSDDFDIGDILGELEEDSKQQTEEALETTDIDEDALINNAEQINSEQPKSQPGVNQILTGADEKAFSYKTELNQTEPIQEELISEENKTDLKQEDYTKNIEEKEGFWNKIKSGFSKIKDLLNLGENKKLKGQELLDTAENNTRSENGDTSINPFDALLRVTEAERKHYGDIYKAQKAAETAKNKGILEVTENTGRSICRILKTTLSVVFIYISVHQEP